MADISIRPLAPGDDLDAQRDLSERAFGVMPAAERARWTATTAASAAQGQVLGAFAGGQPAGAAMYHDMLQWWFGRSVPMAGVAGVKVAPQYRGQGIGRRLMAGLLEQVTARGYPLSALWPATMPVYRSLGWELAGARYHVNVPSRELRSLIPPDPALASGPEASAAAVRPAGPADARTVISVIGAAHKASRHTGPVTFDAARVGAWLSDDTVYAYLAGDGFLAFRWSGSHEMFVEHIVAASPLTYRALWSVLAGVSSTARTISARVAPEDPLWWLTRERDVALDRRSMWMLRVADAPAAIAARGYPPALSLAIPVVICDPVRPANSGRWQLEVSGGQGSLTPAGPGGLDSAGGDSGVLAFSARGLAARYGGTPMTTLRYAGLASGGDPDADAALDASFPGPSFMLDSF